MSTCDVYLGRLDIYGELAAWIAKGRSKRHRPLGKSSEIRYVTNEHYDPDTRSWVQGERGLAYRLYATNIVTWYQDRVVVDLNGWRSVATKQHLRACGFHVYSRGRDGKYGDLMYKICRSHHRHGDCLSTGIPEYDELFGHALPFWDGMAFDLSGRLLGGEDALRAAIEAHPYTKYLRRKIERRERAEIRRARQERRLRREALSIVAEELGEAELEGVA